MICPYLQRLSPGKITGLIGSTKFATKTFMPVTGGAHNLNDAEGSGSQVARPKEEVKAHRKIEGNQDVFLVVKG